MRLCMVFVLVLVLAASAFALEKKAYQMREDFDTEPTLQQCHLQYYYYIPCPTYSWFWAFSGWSPGDIVAKCFQVGDQGTVGWEPCDPAICHKLFEFIILDFAGYGTVYPGLFTFEADVYCAPEYCCGQTEPFLHLWNSGPLETHFGWNYFQAEPPVCVTPCCIEGPAIGQPVVILTATMTGSDAIYPAWGFDNISTAVETGCVLHDLGCLPAVYPRDWCGGVAPKVHSGYVGTFPFQYWPPLAFCDGRDTTDDCSQYGCIEIACAIVLLCDGPTVTQPSTWSSIKSMYK